MCSVVTTYLIAKGKHCLKNIILLIVGKHNRKPGDIHLGPTDESNGKATTTARSKDIRDRKEPRGLPRRHHLS